MSRYAQSVHDSSIAYTQMRTKLYVLTDPMFKMIKLNGLKVSPDAKAMVCWCPDSKELYFEPDKLPPAPKGMQYQLWAIVGGKPIDAGMVQPDAGMQKMKQIANATAFAVTLEKEGGSPAPEGDMYVMGNI
jgi:anti-sigma-K factor RskA